VLLYYYRPVHARLGIASYIYIYIYYLSIASYIYIYYIFNTQ
jgi:hypothetical protein